MQHVEPDVLALVALGEPAADDAERAHLAQCPECAREVAGYAEAATTARSVTAADAIVQPPASVWAAVRAELGLDPALEPDGAVHRAAASESSGSTVPTVPGVPGGQAERRQGSRGREGSQGLRRPVPWLAAAAAAGVLVGGGGVAWWSAQDRGPSAAVVAETALEALPGWDASAEARVHDRGDGTRELVLTLRGGEDVAGYREVWLIDLDVTRLVSLGVLEGSEGTFVLPADLDLAEFPVVDVSDEPYDGDPAHSGVSIVRGVFDA